MKLNRKLFFKVHSWIGIKLSLLFFVVCFSGTLATLSHEMDWLFIPEIRARYEGQKASRSEMAANLEQAYPGHSLEYWSGAEEPYLCDIAYMKRDGLQVYAFVNPYTGRVQGDATITFQRFFRDLHYYLFIPFQIGHFTVLVFGFLLLISLVTALLFYKNWYRKLFELKTGNGPLVFFRSLHRLVGLWSVPFTLLFSVTGIWYFVERTNLAGVSDIANPQAPTLRSVSIEDTLSKHFSFRIDYNRADSIAQQTIPGLEVRDILPPADLNEPIYLTGKSDVALVRNRANRVYLDPVTYEVIQVQRADELHPVTYVNDIADPIHFGNWGGLVTKIIWFFFGLGISSLVFTGIWISLKRKVKSEIQARKQRMGKWKFVNWGIVLVLLFFMYGMLITTYHASPLAFSCITLGWLVFFGILYYLFEYLLPAKAMKEIRSEKRQKV